MSKHRLMRKIDAEVAICEKCGLWRQRVKSVPGVGNINAEAMFVGEAPGRQEDLRGLPFVGAAGKILDGFMREAEISREKVYITNIVKCKPPGNRNPSSDEISTCTGLYLNRQIQIVRPKFLVMLGRHSTAYFLSNAGIEVLGITKIHGKICEINLSGFSIVAIPMVHPAAALYNRKYRSFLKGDFMVLRSELERHKCKTF